MSDWDDKIRKMFSTTFRLPYKQGAKEQAINNVRGEDLLLILETARLLRLKGEIGEQVKTIKIKSGEYRTTLYEALADGRYPEIVDSLRRSLREPPFLTEAALAAARDTEPHKLPVVQVQASFGLNKIYQRIVSAIRPDKLPQNASPQLDGKFGFAD